MRFTDCPRRSRRGRAPVRRPRRRCSRQRRPDAGGPDVHDRSHDRVAETQSRFSADCPCSPTHRQGAGRFGRGGVRPDRSSCVGAWAGDRRRGRDDHVRWARHPGSRGQGFATGREGRSKGEASRWEGRGHGPGGVHRRSRQPGAREAPAVRSSLRPLRSSEIARGSTVTEPCTSARGRRIRPPPLPSSPQ